MAITSFIPKVWSARLTENLHKALVFGSLCNRNWEGDIAQFGDTVHINNLADITVKPYTPNTDIDDPEQLDGAGKVLRAAAMTYVAALAQALAQLLRLLMIANRSRRD